MVFTKTKEECEALLEHMIAEARERIKAEMRKVKTASNVAENDMA